MEETTRRLAAPQAQSKSTIQCETTYKARPYLKIFLQLARHFNGFANILVMRNGHGRPRLYLTWNEAESRFTRNGELVWATAKFGQKAIKDAGKRVKVAVEGIGGGR